MFYQSRKSPSVDGFAATMKPGSAVMSCGEQSTPLGSALRDASCFLSPNMCLALNFVILVFRR